MDRERAFRILGLIPEADERAVQNAYEKLCRRCNPERFVADSDDAREAARIRESAEEAYHTIMEGPDSGKAGAMAPRSPRPSAPSLHDAQPLPHAE